MKEEGSGEGVGDGMEGRAILRGRGTALPLPYLPVGMAAVKKYVCS